MKQHRTSLKDLAAQLGVSIATVSRALRDSHEVSEAMRQKIRELAKQQNYRPNPFAQSLRKETPHILGVVVPNLVTHYYASVLDGIEDYARQNGFTVICANSHEDRIREQEEMDEFVNLHVAGIIACLSQGTDNYDHFRKIIEMGVPIVFFARTCLPELCSSVTGDGDVAAQKATEHLITTGSRRIAFLGGPNHLDMVKRRKHGYLQALREHRIAIDRTLVVCGKIDFNDARQATIDLLKRDDRPDAIIAFNDIITFAAFDAIKSLGLRIPEDVAIVGFTEGDTALFVTPKLTTIADQSYEQGKKACELLVNLLNGDKKIRHEVIPMTLQVRDSSDKHRGKLSVSEPDEARQIS